MFPVILRSINWSWPLFSGKNGSAVCRKKLKEHFRIMLQKSYTCWIYLLYAAAGCTVGGYMLQNIALEHISAKQVGIVQCLYPIATALAAFFVLGETLSPAGIAGAVIITLCVLLENIL